MDQGFFVRFYLLAISGGVCMERTVYEWEDEEEVDEGDSEADDETENDVENKGCAGVIRLKVLFGIGERVLAWIRVSRSSISWVAALSSSDKSRLRFRLIRLSTPIMSFIVNRVGCFTDA